MRKLDDLTILYADIPESTDFNYQRWLQNECKELMLTSGDLYQDYLQKRPDIIIVELALPKSLKAIKKIRAIDEHVCLIALTTESRAEVLREVVELSFTSYLLKPVTQKELQKGLQKALKRININNPVILPDGYIWNPRSKTLLYDNELLSLTKREVKLFELLIASQGKFCNDMDILAKVWADTDHREVSNASIRTLIKNLRRKLPEGIIINQYGLGYRLSL